MSLVFNADEILKMAEQIEIDGAKFYRESAKNTEDPETKDLLLKLASMEDDHLKTFATMRSALPEREKETPTYDPHNEAALYLTSLANTQVFFGKEIDTSSLEEIFKAAITAEKDSVVFYLGMKELVPDYLGKDKLDEIIKEEMSHIRLLNNKLVDIKR
jgi:rubrerythrin